MKYVIFSDTHLGRDFDEKKLVFLKSIIASADRVIIAGDFWEGLQISFKEFINSPWSALFPDLKKKHTVYVFGNHDPQKLTDKNVNLFSDIQVSSYTFKSGDKTFTVEHGDKYRLAIISLSRKLSETIAAVTHTNPQIAFHLESFFFKFFGKDIHQKTCQRMNERIKKQLKGEFTGNNIFICGHTHTQEVDLKHNFVNTGMVRFGLGQYIVIENGIVEPQEKWYNTV
jgi:predicted phosphodiesterase